MRVIGVGEEIRNWPGDQARAATGLGVVAPFEQQGEGEKGWRWDERCLGPQGWAQCPGRAGKRRRVSPRSGEGAMPSAPMMSAPGSDRMSPNRVAVAITSKGSGRWTRQSAGASTRMRSVATAGKRCTGTRWHRSVSGEVAPERKRGRKGTVTVEREDGRADGVCAVLAVPARVVCAPCERSSLFLCRLSRLSVLRIRGLR